VIIGLLKFAAQATFIVLIIILLGAWPSWHFGSAGGMEAMLAAGGVCLVGAIVSLVPMVMAIGKKADWLAQACLGGTVLRMLVTLALGTAVYLAMKPAMMAYTLWVMVFYLVLLVWETKTALKYIRAFYDNVKIGNKE
jgi:hypothetical protein